MWLKIYNCIVPQFWNDQIDGEIVLAIKYEGGCFLSSEAVSFVAITEPMLISL